MTGMHLVFRGVGRGIDSLASLAVCRPPAAASVQTPFGAPNPQPENKKWPREGTIFLFFGAGRGIRTPDLLITNQLLCQLSYSGFLCPAGQL